MGIFEDVDVTTGNALPGEEGHDTNVFATAKKVRHLEPNALLPEWDVIKEAEHIALDGVTYDPPPPEVVVEKPGRVRRSRNGVHPEPVGVS